MYSNSMLMQNSTTLGRCCGFISIRFGCGLICLIWAAFSMYLSVLSFQNSSLFYSYMSSAPITVYGVCNLILSLVSLGGIFLIIWDVSIYIRGLSHAIFVCVFLVLVDSFVNIIVFITYKSEYARTCIESASSAFIKNLNTDTIALDTNQDYYNCNNLWQDELKFSIIFYILMFAFYIYWAFCVYSFSVVRSIKYISDGDIKHGNALITPLAQPPMSAGTGFNPTDLSGGYNDRSIIVLNNAKPKSKGNPDGLKNKWDTFLHMKKSNRTRDSTLKRDFTINFRLGPKGRELDIETAPSPAATFIENPQFIRNLPQEKDELYDEIRY